MKNPEKIMWEIAEKWQNLPPSKTGKWWVYIIAKQIHFRPTDSHLVPEFVLCKISENTVRHGLTHKDWNETLTKIANFQKEGKL